MMKWLPTVISVVVAASAIVSSEVQAWIAAHPEIAAILGGLYAILTNFLPQPHK